MWDKSRLLLVVDEGTKDFILYEQLSEQQVVLGDADWSLCFDDSGVGFVANTASGEKRWCDDLFAHTVLQDPDHAGEVIVVVDGENDVLSLNDFRQLFISVSVKLQSCVGAQHIDLNGFVMRGAHHGVLVLWSLKTLHAALFPKSGVCASRWYLNWWHHWEKSVGKLNVHINSHLRKPQATAHIPRCRHDAANRFLEEPTMSTYVLLNFLVQWASPSKGGKKDEERRLTWELFLKSFIRKYTLDRNVEWSLSIDPTSVVYCNFIVQGANRVRLRVVDGLVDCGPLLECDVDAVAILFKDINKIVDPSAVPVDVLLRWVFSGGRKYLWLQKQFLYWVTCMIDGQVVDDATLVDKSELEDVDGVEPAAPPLDEPEGFEAEDDAEGDSFLQSARVRQAASRKAKEKQLLDTSEAADEGDNNTVLRYFFASRKHCDQHKSFCGAFDASTVGGIGRMLGIITAGGRAVWMPPTDPDTYINFCSGIHKNFLKTTPIGAPIFELGI